MNAWYDYGLNWFVDYYLLSTCLLAIILVAGACMRQPARRLAMAWATAGGLLVLGGLLAIPGWSVVHIMGAPPPRPDALMPAPVIEAEAAIESPPAANSPGDFQLIPNYTPAPKADAAKQPAISPQQPAYAEVREVNLSPYFLAPLLVGSALVVGWLVLGAWQTYRLVSKSSPSTPEVDSLLQALSPERDARPIVRLSQIVKTGVALGLIKPTILLPKPYVEREDAGALRAVLAHELAHLRGGDLWLLAALRVLMIASWANPLYWLLRRRVRLDQETLADAAAAELTSRATYAEQLVGWARQLEVVRPPTLAGAVGLWETKSQLRKRISVLLDERLTILRDCSRKWKLAAIGLCGAAALGLSFLTMEPGEVAASELTDSAIEEPKEKEGPKEKAKANASDGVIEGRVLDELGNPIAGAEVGLVLDETDEQQANPSFEATAVCGKDGRFAIPYNATINRTFGSIWAHATGCAPTRLGSSTVITWLDKRDNAALRLKRAEATELALLDATRNPQPGVTVRVAGVRVPRSIGWTLPKEWQSRFTSVTDDEGLVTIPSVLADSICELIIDSPQTGQVQYNQNFFLNSRPIDLAPHFEICTPKTGAVQGKLTGESEQAPITTPISLQSEVRLGFGPSVGVWGIAEAIPNAGGQFEVANLAEGNLATRVLLDMEGPWRASSPERLKVVKGQTTSFDIKLGRGVTIRGIVRKGDTKEGYANFRLGIIYGNSALKHDNMDEMIELETDELGYYEATVPPGPIELRIQSAPSDYRSIEWWESLNDGIWGPRREVPADVAEFELPPIDLVPAKKIAGQLVDKNERPLTNWIVFGYHEEDAMNSFAGVHTNKQGEFAGSIPETLQPKIWSASFRDWSDVYDFEDRKYQPEVISEQPLVLQVDVDGRTKAEREADELEGAESKTEASEGQSWRARFPDTKIVHRPNRENITGTVVDSDGNPIAAAQLMFGNGQLGQWGDDGKFVIDCTADQQVTVRAYAKGYRMWYGAPSGGDDLRIVLKPKHATADRSSMRVIVVDSRTAEPISGVKVEAIRWDDGRNRPIDATGETSDEGTAVLSGLKSEHYRLRFSANPSVPYIGVQWRSGYAGDRDVVIPLDRACELVLRAVDSVTGEGIAGVLFGREQMYAENWMQDIVPDILGPPDQKKWSSGDRSLTTNTNGEYRCLVAPGTWSYMVAKYPSGYKSIVPINGKQEVELKTVAGGRLEFEFQLVHADAEGALADADEDAVASEGPTTDATTPDATATAPFESIIVRVVNEMGQAVRNAKLTPTGLRVPNDGSWYSWDESNETLPPPREYITDSSGSVAIEYPKFVMERRATGVIIVHASHGDFVDNDTELQVAAVNPTVVVKRGGRVEIAARLASGKLPAGNLYAIDGRWGTQQWELTAGGKLRSPALATEKTTIRIANCPENGPTQFSRLITVTPKLENVQSFDVELELGTRLVGQLDDSVPRPVVGGHVVAQVEASLGNGWADWTEIKEDGTFAFESLPRDEGEVVQLIGICEGYVSTPPGGWKDETAKTAVQTANLGSDEVRHTLTMAPTAKAILKFQNKAGKPIAGVKAAFYPNVSWRSGGSSIVAYPKFSSRELLLSGKAPQWGLTQDYPYESTSDSSGVVTLLNLPPDQQCMFAATHDEYQLPMSLDGRAARVGTLKLESGAFVEQTVVLEANGETLLTNDGEMRPEESNDEGQDDPTVISGVVIGPDGEPLADVDVDAWTWHPGNETKTDEEGRFTLAKFDPGEEIEIEFTKPGFCPRYFVTKKAGTSGWIIKLNSDTWLEGRVLDDRGQPVAHAEIRAERGPFRNPNVTIGEVTTTIETDAKGVYKLYLEPDNYTLKIRTEGGLVYRRDDLRLSKGEQRELGIELEKGITFRAKVVDSITGEPVEGIQLWNWRHKGIKGTSDADGLLKIPGMFPGSFEFNVTAKGADRRRDSCAGDYARWWSPEAVQEHQRKSIKPAELQRNFDDLEFTLRRMKTEMEPVTIVVEQCAVVRGTVVNPDGAPVAGATVAPAKTGSGNSLTGDTRFSYTTKEDGTFEAKLPASGGVVYNLVAHDGKYGEWRNWANGVGEPFVTTPGQVIENLQLQLTRGATVRGQLLDANGQPLAQKRVRAAPADKRDNRYYHPETRTDAKGRFELKFIRPGEHYIQAEPFWLQAEQGGLTEILELESGEVVEDVTLAPPGAIDKLPLSRVDESATLFVAASDNETPSEETSAANDAAGGKLKVFVTSPDGKPITGAKVRQNHVRSIQGKKRADIKNHVYTTDEKGEAEVTWDGNSKDLRLWVTKPGHFPLHAMWSVELQADGDVIPEDFVFPLHQGTTIGGVVQDNDDKPIEGAKVTAEDVTAVYYHLVRGKRGPPALRPVRSQYLGSVTTDAEGRWQMNNVPPDEMLKFLEPGHADAYQTEIRLRVEHPDFKKYDAMDNIDESPLPKLTELREGSAVIALSRTRKPEDESDTTDDTLVQAPQRSEFTLVIAKHMMLLDGKEFVTWQDIEDRIAKLPDPSQARLNYRITAGARQQGANNLQQAEHKRLEDKFNIQGYSIGGLSARASHHYDQLKTVADLVPNPDHVAVGRVIDAKGAAVDGAEVIFAPPVDEAVGYQGIDLYLVDGRLRNHLDDIVVITDDEGRFTIHPASDDLKYYLIVMHPEHGFALAKREGRDLSEPLKLEAWGSIESTILPQEGMEQRASVSTSIAENDGWPGVSINTQIPDRRPKPKPGEFDFPCVPPNLKSYYRRGIIKEQGTSISLPTKELTLKPGEELELTIGGLSPDEVDRLELHERLMERVKPSSAKPVAARTDAMFTAKVVDAETGEPIEQFVALAGVNHMEGLGWQWQPHTIAKYSSGDFAWPPKGQRGYAKQVLRIEAEGYLPFTTDEVVKEAPQRDQTIRLLKSKGISGKVLDPDGNPASDAQVAVAMCRRGVTLKDGSIATEQLGANASLRDRWTQPRTATSDERGQFTIADESALALLVVTHPTGVAMRSIDFFRDNNELQLEPWGKIDGQVLWGDKPGEGVSLVMSARGRRDPGGLQNMLMVNCSGEMTTDKEGRFVFDKVPPGVAQVSRQSKPYGEGKMRSLRPVQMVDVLPGVPTKMTFGGGQPVVGKLVGREDWSQVRIRIAPNAPRPGDMGTTYDPWPAYSAFLASEAGKNYVKNNVLVGADGAFRIDNVPPEHYQLFVSGPKEPEDPSYIGGSSFTIKSANNGDAAIEIGEIRVRPAPKEPAPKPEDKPNTPIG